MSSAPSSKPPIRSPLPEVPWRELARCSTSEARARVPFEHAARLLLLPLGLHRYRSRELLTVANLNPKNSEGLIELKFIAEAEIRAVEIICRDPARAIHAAYHGDEQALQKAASACVDNVKDKPVVVQLAGRSSETEIFDALLSYALSRGASDLHFTPGAEGAEVKLRIDGELYGHGEALYPRAAHEKIISRIKVLSNLDLTCRHLPQDGRFSIPIGRDEVDIRVSFLPTVYGEKAVLRVLGERELRTLHEVGLPPRAHSLLEEALESSEGLILFAGPTGSGKSTTMYAAISELRRRNLSVATVEDPVEIRLNGIAQTAVNEERGLTYPVALRSVLRQDPDVILIGEIRDAESAKIALQAAQTGHLILSTVHAGRANEVFERLKLLGIEPSLVLPSLRAAFVQRLVARLCSGCSGSMEVHACSECGGIGRRGRVLLAEALALPSASLGALNGTGSDIAAAIAAISPQSYLSIAECAEEAFNRGEISNEELQKFSIR